MAIIYRADLHPSKLELIGPWLRDRLWYPAVPEPELLAVGAYRFDDPGGEVGIETHLVRAGSGPVLQVPLTYRDSPLPDAEPWLLGTMEHSVLGRRWVYDACADPVYVTALAATIFSGGSQADEIIDVNGCREPRAATASVTGSGTPDGAAAGADATGELTCSTDGDHTSCSAGDVELVIRRVVDPSAEVVGEHTLTGTWAGQVNPVLLASGRRR